LREGILARKRVECHIYFVPVPYLPAVNSPRGRHPAIVDQLIKFARRYAEINRSLKLCFDDTDYSVVVKNRRPPPNPWRWEIYRAGKSNPMGQSPSFFCTVAAANKERKAALKELLAKLNSSPST
jgi:hypothetical protein